MTTSKLASPADITDVLDRSQQRLNRIQALAHLGSWELDTASGCLTWSDELYRILGRTPQEGVPTHESFMESVQPDDRAAVDSARSAFLRQENTSYDSQYRIVRKADGKIRWVRERGLHECDHDGRIVRSLGVVQDITWQRRVLQKLRSTLDSIGDALFTCDRDWRFIYLNNSATRLLGIRRDRLQGKVLWDVFPFAPGTTLEQEYRRAAAGEIRSFENYYERKTRWFQHRCFPREDGGVSVYLQDITERKQAEQDLIFSHTVLDHMWGAVLWVSADGRFRFANKTCSRLLGYTRDALLSMTVSDLDPNYTPEKWREAWLALNKVGHGTIESTVRTSTRGIIPVELNISYFEVNGEGFQSVIMRDLTRRKLAEEAQRKAHEELERKVKERTAKLRDLAAELLQAESKERRRIAHVLHEDLQQHLVAMQLRVSLLKERHKDDLDAQDADWLLKELSRTIETSRDLTSRLRPAVLYELGLRPALEWLAGDMAARFGLTVNLEGEPISSLGSDEIGIFVFESVRELLLNVTKHAEVKTAWVRLQTIENERVVIEVLDKGNGFDAAQITHKQKFGLFSIRERAEALGGSFKVTSQPGKGTRALLSLPTGRSQNPACP